MMTKQAVAALVLVSVLAGCSGGSSPDPAGPEPAPETIRLTETVDRAQDVSDQLDQRQAEMESMLP